MPSCRTVDACAVAPRRCVVAVGRAITANKRRSRVTAADKTPSSHAGGDARGGDVKPRGVTANDVGKAPLPLGCGQILRLTGGTDDADVAAAAFVELFVDEDVRTFSTGAAAAVACPAAPCGSGGCGGCMVLVSECGLAV